MFFLPRHRLPAFFPPRCAPSLKPRPIFPGGRFPQLVLLFSFSLHPPFDPTANTFAKGWPPVQHLFPPHGFLGPPSTTKCFGSSPVPVFLNLLFQSCDRVAAVFTYVLRFISFANGPHPSQGFIQLQTSFLPQRLRPFFLSPAPLPPGDLWLPNSFASSPHATFSLWKRFSLGCYYRNTAFFLFLIFFFPPPPPKSPVSIRPISRKFF